MEHYETDVTCWNCGITFHWKIPKGTTIDDYEDYHPCDNCGCHVKLREVLHEN